MKKKVLISLLVFTGLLIIAILIAYLTILFRKPTLSNLKNNQKAATQQVATTNIVNILRENKFDDALIDVNKQLSNDSDNVELLLLKANILLAKGSVQFKEKEFALKAQDILYNILKREPRNTEALSLLGYSYEIQNLFQDALVNYNKALAIKKTADVYNWKGHTYDLMGDIQQAEKFYKKAIEMEGNNRMALRNLSRVYLRLDRNNDARKILEKLIKMPVDNIRLVAGDYHSLGTIYFENGDVEQAEKMFNKALEIDPTFMLAQVEMAKYKVLFEGKKEEAIKLLNKIVQDYPKQVAPLEWLGFAYLENNEFDKSIEQLNRAIELIPSDITLMGQQKIIIRSRLNYYLSLAYSLNNNIDKSKECFLKIMEGYDKRTLAMLVSSLKKGEEGPYKNIMNDPDINKLVKKISNFNK